MKYLQINPYIWWYPMSPRFPNQSRRTLASPKLEEAWLDFFLSRQIKNCTQATLEFYDKTAYLFMLWLEDQGVHDPQDITSRHIMNFLYTKQEYKDSTRHAYARAIKTLMIYMLRNNDIRERIYFDMPKVSRKTQPYLTRDQLNRVLKVCNTRDRAMIAFMADCGIRVSELCKLNWGDVDFKTGIVHIIQGKGQKDRSVVVGAVVLRHLLRYRRNIEWTNETPLFLSRTKGRLTRTGVLIVCRRIRKLTNIHITPHALRRTFVMLSLENNTDPGHIQRMMGQTSLDMTYYYADMGNIDLMRLQHSVGSPIDNL